jgi:hypothetical protein
MAFAFTKDNEAVEGDLRWTYGTYTSTGAGTGGDIYTGLQRVYGALLQEKGSAVVATQAVVNETFPMNDPVTIVTVANGVGFWAAWGV